MNLKSTKARVPIAALGLAALIAGAGAIASPALAQSTVTLSSNTATTVNTLDIGAAATVAGGTAFANAALAKAAYGLNITSTNTYLKLSLDSYTAPGASVVSVGGLHYLNSVSDTPVATGWTDLTSSTTAPVLSAAFNTNASPTPYVYLAPDLPGTYKVHIVDTQGTVATDDDISSPTITLTVKDVETATPATSDDFTPSVTNNVSTTGIGAPITTTVDLSGLTLTDGRGSSNSKGVLGDAIAALTGVAFSGSALPGPIAAHAVSNPAGTLLLPVNSTTTAGTLTATASFDSNGDGTFGDDALGTANTTVSSNGVATVTGIGATAVTGSILAPSSAVATVKTGTAAVTYTAVAKDVTPAVVAGATVYFTVTPGANTPVLTTDGTLVSSTSSAQIYSATTNSQGIASLTVTSATTTAGTAYTVSAASNGHTQTAPTPVVATYTAPAAASFTSANSADDLTPTPTAGMTVTLKGNVLDQFGNSFTPAVSATQTVTVAVPSGGPTICAAVIMSGSFSCNYMPATTPTAGTQTSYSYTYGAASYTGQISYASSAVVASISLTAPVDGATAVTLQDNTTPTPAQNNAGTPAFGNSSGAVTGTVYDSTNATVAYKAVALSGTDGVYFSTSATPDAAHPLVKTLTVVTSSTGAIGGAYVYFTEAGTAKVTATAGTGTATSTVTTDVAASTQGYTVSVDDVAGSPGSTLIVTGKVLDLFGNPVQNASVDLSTGASTVGALGASNVTTNTGGIFSTTFVSGSNQSGDVTLTATLHGQTANATAVTAYKTAGLTIANGVYQATGKITVADTPLVLGSISKATSHSDGAKVTISGSFLPASSVDIYSQPSGAASYQLVGSTMTDSDGNYSKSFTIKKSASFLARSNGMSSAAHAATVYSAVSITAKSSSKGHVTISANGSPNAKGTLTFYWNVTGPDKRVKTLTSSSSGNGTATVRIPSGKRGFHVTFTAPGTDKGTSKEVVVKVK